MSAEAPLELPSPLLPIDPDAPTAAGQKEAPRPALRHAPFAPGLTLAGRFELVRPLGAGGLAEVWQARDLLLGADVALKALHAHLSRDLALGERFRRELAVTRGLDHPGIVQVYDCFELEGRPFFTMELLEGQPLADRLREGALPREEALRIAREIAAALQAAHRAGVVHRDLKPQNVFLCGPAGVKSPSPRVKLLDFGLARVAGQERMTAASTVLGTPGYIAPEVLAGATADARADLYALGAVLYELLSGRRAFPSADAFAVLAQKGTPPRLGGALPGALPADETLVARLLEPDPERRFLDAGQVLRALGGGEVGEAPEAPPALTAGGFAVVLRPGLFDFFRGAALERVRRRLGEPPRSLWRRVWFWAPVGTLVTGASRASAEEAARLCREEGVAAQVVPASVEGPLEWLGQRADPLAFGLAGLVFARLTAVAVHWGIGYARLIPRFLSGELPLDPADAPPVAVRRSIARLAEQVANHPDLTSAAAWVSQALLQALPAALILALLFSGLPALLLPFQPALLGQPPRRWRLGRAGALLASAAAALAVGALLQGDARGFLAAVLSPGYSQDPWYTLAFGLEPLRLPGQLLPSTERLRTPLGLDLVALAGAVVGALALYPALRAKGRAGAPLPEGDPAVRRLAAGIERRVERLRERTRAAPLAEQGVLRPLLLAAEGLARSARPLAEEAAREGDEPAAAGPLAERPTLPHGAAARRDLLLGRLLRIAAALDEALALALGSAATPPDELDGALRRLQAEVAEAPAPALAAPLDRTPVDPARRVRP